MYSLKHAIAVRLLSKTSQRLKYRHVWFRSSVLLDALAAADSDRALLTNRMEEGSDDCRLADSRLARNEYDPSLSLQHLVKPPAQLLQLSLTANHDLCADSGRSVYGRTTRACVCVL